MAINGYEPTDRYKIQASSENESRFILYFA